MSEQTPTRQTLRNQYLEVLRAVVRPLAEPPDSQLRTLDGLFLPGTCRPYELTRRFISLWDMMKANADLIGVEHTALRDALQILADFLEWLPSEAWSEDSLRQGREWEAIREKALRVLYALDETKG